MMFRLEAPLHLNGLLIGRLNGLLGSKRPSNLNIRKAYFNMKVSNLKSPRSGSPVANQYEIEGDDGTVTFQSYQTPIAQKNGYKYRISADWCYSVTTSKYFNQWLRDWGWYDSEIAELKKWLKQDRKDGDQVAILSPSNIEVTYVEELK